MDYILEELERQRQAMERLLASGPVGRQTVQQETPAASVPYAAEEELWTEDASGAVPAVFPNGMNTAATARNESAAAFRRRHPQLRLRATGERRWIRSADEVPENREIRAVPQTIRTETSGMRLAARELSRTVEREARRYDSGFEMY